MAQCEICKDGKEYSNLGVHMSLKHKEPAQEVQPSGSTVAPLEVNKTEELVSSVLGVVSTLADTVKRIGDKVDALEIKAGGRDDSFKKNALQSDISKAELSRKGADERISKIVNETLGEDFGIEIEPRVDQPGFLFTLIVPRRLSDVSESTRPIKSEDGKYVMNTNTGQPEEEKYWPEDRRSRAISSNQSYDSIKDYCEKVRAYIVGYYTKLQKPVPEFKIKSYV